MVHYSYTEMQQILYIFFPSDNFTEFTYCNRFFVGFLVFSIYSTMPFVPSDNFTSSLPIYMPF